MPGRDTRCPVTAAGPSITVCDDRAGAEASDQRARDDIAAKLSDLPAGAPEVHVGEVAMAS